MTLETADTKISVQDQMEVAMFIVENASSFSSGTTLADAKAFLASVIAVEENTGP